MLQSRSKIDNCNSYGEIREKMSEKYHISMQSGFRAEFNQRDSILYSISIGCSNMKYVYEKDPGFTSFPTIALALTLKGDSTNVQDFPPQGWMSPPLSYTGPVLDGERYMELNRGLRSREAFKLIIGQEGIMRSKSGVVVQTKTVMRDAHDEEVVRIISNTFYRGASDEIAATSLQSITRPVPENRTPDFVVLESTRPDQTLLYRLNGDYNPLHIDHAFAREMGYERPIMHGLCTLGIAARIVVTTCLNLDESRVKRLGCRFTAPVYTGAILVVEMWIVGGDSIAFRVKDKESGRVVVDRAFIDHLPSSRL